MPAERMKVVSEPHQVRLSLEAQEESRAISIYGKVNSLDEASYIFPDGTMIGYGKPNEDGLTDTHYEQATRILGRKVIAEDTDYISFMDFTTDTGAMRVYMGYVGDGKQVEANIEARGKLTTAQVRRLTTWANEARKTGTYVVWDYDINGQHGEVENPLAGFFASLVD